MKVRNAISAFLFTFCLIVSHTLIGQCKEQVEAGSNHSLVIDSDGTLWLSGKNTFGQLGDGTSEHRKKLQNNDSENWKVVSGGRNHTMAIKTDGTLWGWGSNIRGELGDNTYVDKLEAVQIGGDSDWMAVSAGRSHTIALKTDGTLWGWGNNSSGQLANGTTIGRIKIPTQIGTDTDWKVISAGGDFNMALKTDNSLWSWGLNTYGQVGDGTTMAKSIVICISPDNDWKYISAGHNHSLAIKNNGTLWSWGKNTEGQLGDGVTVTNRNSPFQVGNEHDWLQVSGGWDFSLAIKKDKTLWSFGVNLNGQLGNGGSFNKNEPTQVGKASNWEKISAGANHAIALNSENRLYTWGKNNEGQLADNTFVNKRKPTPIGKSCSLSITDIVTPEKISLYPNPTNDKITLRFGEYVTQAKLVLLTIYGQVITQKNISGTDVATLEIKEPAGVYLIKIDFPDKEAAFHKVIKK